jgi:hypothetical protein
LTLSDPPILLIAVHVSSRAFDFTRPYPPIDATDLPILQIILGGTSRRTQQPKLALKDLSLVLPL